MIQSITDNIISSIIQNDKLVYPSSEYYFSPSEHYPEYPFCDISPEENLVYDAVRNIFYQAGYDRSNYNTPNWNPLSDIIKKGDKVFILCNFVFHRKSNETLHQFYSKCTHGSVIRALMDYVFLATGSEGVIRFGNAPLQSCDFEKVLEDTAANKVEDFYKKLKLDISSRDLRMYISEESLSGRRIVKEIKENHHTTTVNLDELSLLEKQKNNGNYKYRVSNYDHTRTEKLQGKHNHRYIINNEILTSDVIISVPKLKTHEKVGITVGLKGFVGIVGHKDCLAHHRFGSPSVNGDEYPNNNFIRMSFSLFHDIVNRYNRIPIISPILQVTDKLIRRVARNVFRWVNAGAWHGNDTAWRMTLDLSRIVHFADINGNMRKTIQRKNIILIDGVVGGEGEGPLAPNPVNSSVLILSSNVAYGDNIASNIMGYDYKKIPLLLNSQDDLGLLDINQKNAAKIIFNEKYINLETIKDHFSYRYQPPRGWKGYI